MPTDADGCDWRPGARYDAVHELLEALGDAAYLRQSQFSWEAFVRNYGVWLAFLAAVLLGIVVHSVRAEYLIRRRTTELMRAVEEKRRVEEEAKRYNERLVAMERADLVGELSSMIAHELKQPLAVIRNYARGLSRTMAHGGSADPEVFRTVLAKIDSQSTKASDIIDHVRSFARQPAQPVPTSLSDLAEKAIAQFCATRGLEVSRRIEPGVTILADALEMELLISRTPQTPRQALMTPSSARASPQRTARPCSRSRTTVRGSPTSSSPASPSRSTPRSPRASASDS